MEWDRVVGQGGGAGWWDRVEGSVGSVGGIGWWDTLSLPLSLPLTLTCPGAARQGAPCRTSTWDLAPARCGPTPYPSPALYPCTG